MSPRDAGSHDPERVVRLRLTALERTGYERAAATHLAELLELPLQEALDLVRAGFPPDVAYELLTTDERPVF